MSVIVSVKKMKMKYSSNNVRNMPLQKCREILLIVLEDDLLDEELIRKLLKVVVDYYEERNFKKEDS